MENKRTQMKVAMTFGAMYGLSASVIGLIFFFIGVDFQSKIPQYLNYILLILFIIFGVKSYRDQDLGGFISYGKSLGTGVLIGVFGGFITGIYTVLLFTVIDPGLVQKILEASQQQLIDKGMPEDQIQMGLSWTRKLMSPVFLFLFSVLGSAFVAMVFSLIVSVFMKKEATPFDSRPLDS
ncbi:MAG: DUF4199 domain-containing protein [Bacteroidetes bacterium]|nr:DUF4199 domain-containing protein [Bacteroidota bacterium]